MRRPGLLSLLSLGLLLLPAPVARAEVSAGAAGAEGAASAAPDPRSVQVFDLDCGSPLGRRQVTLFANGTVRLREGEPGKEAMGLAELRPEELRGALARLAEEDLGEIAQLPRGVDGEWVERCELRLALAERPARTFRFGRYDALPLPLSRVLRVVEDCAAKVGGIKGKEHLPEGYDPHPGDRLKRTDGQLYEVISFTADNKGVELWGVDQPLTLYVLRVEMGREFVALVSRARK
ncbi:MAG TPA: hypothetical protein VGR07_15310 [Thermoanaerobaculia bacterium]|nr:hypothetical protein [Thermoanaerobaculia bacterium]